MTVRHFSKGTYEITVSPDDRHQFFGRYGKRLQWFWTKIHPLLINALDHYDIEYKMYLELSEPHINVNKSSTTSRLHFHGTITFKDDLSVGYYLLESQYKMSRWCNTTINDYRPDVWPEYIRKQRPILRALCAHERVPYSITHKKPLLKRPL